MPHKPRQARSTNAGMPTFYKPCSLPILHRLEEKPEGKLGGGSWQANAYSLVHHYNQTNWPTLRKFGQGVQVH